MLSDAEKSKLVVVETISSVCWFLMDASWMFTLYDLAKVMALLTIVTSLWVFRYTERTWSDMLVTASVACWACMNVLWMLNDSKMIDWGLKVAAGFFFGGAICLVAAFFCARNHKDILDQIIARFRRLRISRRD